MRSRVLNHSALFQERWRHKIKTGFGSFAKSLRSSRKTILLISITAVVTLILSAIISIWLSRINNFGFPSVGTISTRGVEAYWDKELTNKTEAYDWGMIYPGVTKNVTLYLRSISNIETTLNLTPENWTFLDSGNRIVAGPSNTTPYMNLTWNYNNTLVHPNEILQVTLTLSVDSSSNFIEFIIAHDVKAFSLDTYISTSEYSYETIVRPPHTISQQFRLARASEIQISERAKSQKN